jgi:hypothetical protein
MFEAPYNLFLFIHCVGFEDKYFFLISDGPSHMVL